MLGINLINPYTLPVNQVEPTEMKTQNLIERFNNAEEKATQCPNGEERRWYPEHFRMERELAQLLSNEIGAPYMLNYNNGKELLEEYKENFEWDTEYSVCVCWEFEPSTYTNSVNCSSPEEIKEYLCRQKHPELPDWKDDKVNCAIEYGCGFTGDNSLEAEISVSNLRPKQPKQKYLLSVLAESEFEGSAVIEQLNTLLPAWEVLSITPSN